MVKAGFRQGMATVHGWAGLLVGWLLYFVFVTGTIGYFNPELDRWMRPEEPPAIALPATDVLVRQALERLRVVGDGAESWSIGLPGHRGQATTDIGWRGMAGAERGSETLDPATGKPLREMVRETGGGRALYVMHYELRYMPDVWGIWIVGVGAMTMLLAIVTGVITHKKIFKDIFTFRPAKKQRSWLDGHNLVSVAALPFCLMITYSGLIFFDYQYIFAAPRIVYGPGNEDRFFEELSLRRRHDAPATTGRLTGTAPIGPIVAQAERAWGRGGIESFAIRNPGRGGGAITLRRISSGISRGQGETMMFDGVTGGLLRPPPSGTEVVGAFRAALLGLHEGLFASGLLRWLYFLSGCAGTLMIATGMVLWTVKRREKAQRSGADPLGLRMAEHMNAGVIGGLPIGIAAYFWANRLLCVTMADRAAWEMHILFLAWGAAFTIAAICKPQSAWRLLVSAGSAGFVLLPVINALTTNRHLGHSLATGDWLFAGVDLTMAVVGGLLGVIAFHLGGRRGATPRSWLPSVKQAAA